MREIKFRAWNSGKMLTGITLASMFYEGLSGEAKGFRYNGMPLMQYTGRFDKNGVEIYDGDILRREETDFTGDHYANDYCEVMWKNAGWWVKFIDEELTLDDYQADTGEVVGNVHENPELLPTYKAGHLSEDV